jgi:thiamine-phosphate pyrophosphorylase
VSTSLSGLYAIVDPEHCARRDPAELARAILRGGCCALQLRAKRLSDRAALALSREVKAQCRVHGVPFWINDRLDLACLVEADGLHLGQDDLAIGDARKLWGARPLGVSTHSLAQVDEARAAGADLIGFGPVFMTGSKERPDPVVGVSGLVDARARFAGPVVAIGGITLERVPDLKRAGIRVAAVIAAVTLAEDPEAAARALHTALS